MKVKQNQSLKKLNTFEIDANARFFVEIANEDQLSEALEFAKENRLEVFVLGGGSNILIGDGGFDGLVIKNGQKGIDIDGNTVKVGAGEIWDEVVAKAVEQNLFGTEWLSGVPGTAGGAVVQNIGAYGQTLGDVVIEVHAVETATGKSKVFTPEECQFAYRNSLFKQNPNKYIVTKFVLKLKQNGESSVNYPNVKKYFGDKKLNLQEVRNAVIEIRASKGYVIMPGYECYKTAGSFFKNPIVSQDEFKDLRTKIPASPAKRGEKDDDIWFWEMPEDKVKVAAAKLMQEAGFPKGYQDGKVGISPKHSLSLINLGNAKAQEIKTLAKEIKNSVFQKFGVKLEEEVIFVGDYN
ncbi:MAG TPA: UDP-N-acetylmuramate dehydrogenase [Patescibacteria group bacterium]|jgi:UDP-N-acetylmuramate dehydrogenase|nr:UDP-N-acetylmuramate dehydrogenase [Patescibacteria group bacterium]